MSRKNYQNTELTKMLLITMIEGGKFGLLVSTDR